MLTVWGRRSSFNLQKAMWLVGELAIEHRHIEAGGQFGGLDTPEFRAMNPHGRVPVIDDNGTIVWESHAILRYLAARAMGGAHSGAMTMRRGRSRIDGWIGFKPRFSRTFFLASSGDSIALQSRSEIFMPSRSGSTSAQSTFSSWIDGLQIGRSCWVTGSRWLIFRSAPISIAISIWISSAPLFPT